MNIRDATTSDADAIRRVVLEAFGQEAEANLVDALRDAQVSSVSLVAEIDDVIVGHILFTPVTLERDESAVNWMGLAPLSVAATHQRSGIGKALSHEGIERCRADGCPVVVVLGHPTYYPKFGFVPAAPMGIYSEYDVPDDTFMIQELTPGALTNRVGIVRYHPIFNAL